MKIDTLEVGARQILSALDQRLAVTAGALLGHSPESGDGPPGELAAMLLPDLVAATGSRRGSRQWLLLTAVGGAFPAAADVEQLARRVELDDPDLVARDLLHWLHGQRGRLTPHLEMDLVSDKVVVDVDFCARNDKNTGIQRVTRHVLPFWDKRGIVPVSHTRARSAYRSLDPRGHSRVFRFGEDFDLDDEQGAFVPRLVVPWGTTVLWPEVPHVAGMRRLAGMVQYSGNAVGMIGYDMIPILSAHLRPTDDGGIFSQYLSAVKHADRIAGISASAAEEFRGFSEMLVAQGIEGPTVLEVELAEDAPHKVPGPRVEPKRPVVLLTGRRELHKNVHACVHAAQRLWSEGLDFELVTLGDNGWSESDLTATVARLIAEGRPVTTLGWVTDEEMWCRIRDASFVVFASLHEGYGLPVSEALSLGTPVVTTDYGSQREIADRGGCLVVDPRSDEAIADAMRVLISSPSALDDLRQQIGDRPRRTWQTYADELWRFLVDGTEPDR